MTHYASCDRDDTVYTKSGVMYVTRGVLDVALSPVLGAAGVYTCDVVLPPTAMVHEVSMTAVAYWNAGTSAVGTVGDYTNATPPVAITANGYFTAVAMDAVDLVPGETISTTSQDAAGGQEGAYVTATHSNGRYRAAASRVRFIVTVVGVACTTGNTICEVVWSLPADLVTCTFV